MVSRHRLCRHSGGAGCKADSNNLHELTQINVPVCADTVKNEEKRSGVKFSRSR